MMISLNYRHEIIYLRFSRVEIFGESHPNAPPTLFANLCLLDGDTKTATATHCAHHIGVPCTFKGCASVLNTK